MISSFVSKADPAVKLFKKLRNALEEYLDKEQIERIYQAYLLARGAHEGQMRKSGEEYITHPVAVAEILAHMRLDPESIMAALMHDVIEDTGVDKKTLAEKFGDSVAELVDGVSKLTQIKFESRAEAQAENFRKMVLAMVRDIRVILIKLADRLHNMQTLESLPQEKRSRIALETLEIYAPIANRLGMHSFRVEFEDLGFAALHPMRYRILQEAVAKARGNRKEIVKVIESALQACLKQKNVPVATVYGREKHLYSIYKKMRNKKLSFNEIMDIYAFRIIVDDLDSCYRILGVVHNLYKPVPERFKDYIAIPKTNGYQSLHTTLFGPYGVPIEIQIRSKEMDRMAENGIASHWLYKSGETADNEAQMRAREWLKGLLEMQQSTGSSLEFIENVKIDLFPDEVYVFTPNGDIVKLPSGATAVDFAYAVHSDIGNSCIATKINRRLAPLSSTLINGQTVEIITAAGARPNSAWLNFVVTGKARSNIRHFLKGQQRAESIALGKRLLEKALDGMGQPWQILPQDNIEAVLRESNYKNEDELFENIGLGNQVPLVVARRLAVVAEPEREAQASGPVLDTDVPPLSIKGSEGMVVNFASCCRPIPGDPIVGLLSSGRGLIVHNEQCRKVLGYTQQAGQFVNVCWEDEVEGEFEADIRVFAENRRGVLAMLAHAISDADSNIVDIAVEERDGRYSQVSMTLAVRNRVHLARVMRRLRSVSAVNKIKRQ